MNQQNYISQDSYSMRVSALVFIFLLFNCFSGKAQVKWKIDAGISYIEHFSTGIEMDFREKHSLSILYGSDFFIQTRNSSSWMLQYKRCFPAMKFGHFTPGAGIKGGYSVYTNHYYQWKLLALVPFVGVNRPISNKWSLAMDMGMVFSRTLSMKRLNYGEAGWYKEILPELKLAVSYHL